MPILNGAAPRRVIVVGVVVNIVLGVVVDVVEIVQRLVAVPRLGIHKQIFQSHDRIIRRSHCGLE